MIGCGALGLIHTQRLNAIAGVEIAGVSDPDIEAMTRCKDSALDPENVSDFSDYKTMLKEMQLDAVCISSPNPFHVEQILASLESGCHVLCEKPLTMDREEAKKVGLAATVANKHVAIAYQSRYRRDSRALKRALQSGEWGKINSINLFACEDWMTPNGGTWRHDPKLCPAGYFGDANGHQLDLVCWLSDSYPEQVSASMLTRGTQVPMLTWGTARMKAESSIFPLTFLFDGTATGWREEISIQTEGADFVMRDTRLFWTDGSAPLAHFPESLYHSDDVDDTPDSAFVALLRGEQPAVSPPLSVNPVILFTLMAMESWKSSS